MSVSYAISAFLSAPRAEAFYTAEPGRQETDCFREQILKSRRDNKTMGHRGV